MEHYEPRSIQLGSVSGPISARVRDGTPFMPSQNIFMSVVEYGPIRLWDLATGRERFTVTTETNLPPGPPLLRMAPDGSWVLTGLPNATGEFQLREVETGHLRWSSTVTNGAGHLTVSPIVSPDGRWIACGGSSFDKTRVISTATGEVQTPLGNAWPVAFSRDGDAVAAVTHSTADADSPTVVTLWDTGTGRAGRRIASGQPDPGSIALSPDGHGSRSARRHNVISRRSLPRSNCGI